MAVGVQAASAIITASIAESIRVKQAVLDRMVPDICRAAEQITNCLRSGKKVLLAGNGGSAADAQHVAAEFIGRFERERRAWPAICLSTDTSVLTAIGNDYSVDLIFARQVEALGAEGDVFMAYSTSGNSPNVVRAARTARERGMQVIAFCGEKGGELADSANLALCVPSRRTARIQESHITISHTICEVVETELARTDSGYTE
jgi:D-sedoheptulose 7-phosphate isomerase